MTLDLDELEARIAEGERKNLFVAPIVKQLIAELREARKERPAVVAYLRAPGTSCDTAVLADAIARGEHRP